MMTTLFALLVSAPASALPIELDRESFCNSMGGEWDASAQTCTAMHMVWIDIEKIRFGTIEMDGLVQIEVLVSEDRWTSPMSGELYVRTSDGDFARAPLELAVELYAHPEESATLAEELELERTENPLEHMLNAMGALE